MRSPSCQEALKRHGSVKDGTALTDTAAEEIERGYSINLGCAYAEWQDTKINLHRHARISRLPGRRDRRTRRRRRRARRRVRRRPASKSAPSGCSAKRSTRRDPGAVRRLDDGQGARELRPRSTSRSRRGSRTRSFPVEVPVGEGAEFHGDRQPLHARRRTVYKRGVKTGEYEEIDIPAEAKALFDRYYEELIESISATDDTLLERYLEGGEIARDEAIAGMKEAMKREELFPLFCVSCETELRDAGGAHRRSSSSCRTRSRWKSCTRSRAPKATRRSRSTRTTTAPFAAHVFKTTSEPHVGDVTLLPHLLRHRSPTARKCSTPRADGAEKLNHLSVAQGKERVEIADAACRRHRLRREAAQHAHERHAVHERASGSSAAGRVPGADRMAVHALDRAATKKSCSRACIACTTRIRRSRRTTTPRRTRRSSPGSASGTSRSTLSKLKRKFGVTAELVEAKIAYRETITAKAEGQGRHKKQSGGRGQFGDCWVRFAPPPRGHGLRVRRRDRRRLDPAQVHSGGRPRHSGSGRARRARRLSDRRLRRRAVRRLVSLRRLERNVVQDGRHSGLQDGRAKCKPVLLEPLDELEISTPDDVPRRRARRPLIATRPHPRHRVGGWRGP